MNPSSASTPMTSQLASQLLTAAVEDISDSAVEAIQTLMRMGVLSPDSPVKGRDKPLMDELFELSEPHSPP